MAEIGDSLSMDLINDCNLMKEVSRAFCLVSTEQPPRLYGELAAKWTVHHEKHRSDTEL